MKYLTLSLLLAFASGLTGGCNPPQKQSSVSSQSILEWLPGTWTATQGDVDFGEIWTWQNDSTLLGFGWQVQSGDTSFVEELAIISRDDTLRYMALVPDQNEGLPVFFTSLDTSSHSVRFENLLHDFPTAITYKMTDSSSLFITLEGATDQGEQRIAIELYRE